MGSVVPPKEPEVQVPGLPGHGDALGRLQHAIDHASHLLPAQGPITVFIHHNTLHAFEGSTFDAAVRRGAEIFNTQPYLSEERYRAALTRGRIRLPELRAVLADDLRERAAEKVAGLCTRLQLRLARLQAPAASAPAEELRWFVAETDALKKVRPEAPVESRLKLIAETRRWIMRDVRALNGSAPRWVRRLLDRYREPEIEQWGEPEWEAFALELLWAACQEGVKHAPELPPQPPPVRHRDLLLAATGSDADYAVNELLIRFCAAFLDQGVAHWALPEREKGFFHCFCSLYRQPGESPATPGLARELARVQDAKAPPIQVVAESLVALGVAESEWDDYLARVMLSLRGWGGMIQQLEARPDRAAKPVSPGTLVEFVAVRLVLDRFAVAAAAKERLGYAGPLAGLRDELRKRVKPPAAPGAEERAFPVFRLSQVLGWAPDELDQLGPAQWRDLYQEVEAFDSVERRRVFHLAYESRFNAQSLDALALHERRKVRTPRFQVVTCIDEREESFRRHLEEVAPDCETLSTAGFFAVAMYYRGAEEAHHVPLCPVVITPKHWVEEEPDEGAEGTHKRTRWLSRLFGKVSHAGHVVSRTAVVGSLFAGTLGVLASIPLVSRVLFPRQTAHLKHKIKDRVGPARTRLRLERTERDPGPQCGHVGFTVDEMAVIAERVLRDVGLARFLSRIVLTIGHGSHSMNNPHESAHDCGACGGSRGGPNGRAVAQILNDPRVRASLAARGLEIPRDTVFVGGFHNTCNEYVQFFDTHRIPETHREEFAAAKAAVDAAILRNAHERCRRFESAPLTITPEQAQQHLDDRAEDLAQVRPEWGHATNAMCVVGRRERTRGLFFDRRAFLTSYDPTQDTPDSAILTRTLAAVFPVCGGINLEYYFSHTDPTGYGCGTKLPHNITSLLGVMDGAASDLRTGLPWQMVEIHEPVRLLIVCETTPEKMLGIMRQDTPVGKTVESMTRNGWVYLALLDPHSQTIWFYRNGEFHEYTPRAAQLPVAASSLDWYRGWRDFLEFAEIGVPVAAH
jgi:uncharacterized protein YbcC (UPF0753/DUF2309 family)